MTALHDLNAVWVFRASFVLFHGLSEEFPSWSARLDPFCMQRVGKPVGIVTRERTRCYGGHINSQYSLGRPLKKLGHKIEYFGNSMHNILF